ncbi:MAG: thiamine-phosphate kinase [Arenicellales bacterium]
MGEFEIIEKFFKHQGVQREDVVLGIGDDAAILRPAAGRDLVMTTDVLVNGVHFPESTDPADIGHKSLAVNLSDIAAMGAVPAWATLCLTMPEAEERWLEGFCSGFFALAERYRVQLVGGDTANGPLSVAVHLTGFTGEAGCLHRGGARDDDVIYVSGTLGDAALGLQCLSGMLAAPGPDRSYLIGRLNRPSPRIELGRAVCRYASAAIDISDGLAADLGHICESSGVGALVDVSRLPISESYRRLLSKVGWEPAMSFGDDYELCFTVPQANTGAVERAARDLGLRVTPVGHISGRTVQWTHGDQPFSLHEQGYRHFR